MSSPKSLPIVRGAVDQMAIQEGLSKKDAHGLVLSIDEALANVIKHGYEGRHDQPVTITLAPVVAADGRKGISVVVRDQGKQVDPQSICGRDLDDVRPGGLGVHIIRAMMDEAEYSCPPEGGMMLRMVKYASAEGASD
ncbi:MAG: ATP-binding protein [Phycisphaerales bacterium]|nr:ATP-binding protein [Phycisphaerales bacterium]